MVVLRMSERELNFLLDPLEKCSFVDRQKYTHAFWTVYNRAVVDFAYKCVGLKWNNIVG